MDAVGALWRSQLRRRWRTWIALGLLLAIGAGAGMACLAGARRTASAFDRFAAASGFPDVNSSHGLAPADAEATIEGFAGVRSHATVVGFVGAVDGIDPTAIKYFIGSWETPVPRIGATLRAGRFPSSDRADEVLVVGKGAEIAGLAPGDELTVELFTSDFSGTVTRTVVVVGLGDDPLAAVADATYDRTGMYFTPAFTRANAADLRAWAASEFIAAPTPGAQAQLVSQLNDQGWSIDETRPVAQARVQDAIRPLVTVLALLGALVALATLLVVGQSMARQSDESRAERLVAVATGCTPGQPRAVDALCTLSVALPGTVLALGLAVAASSRFPTGAVRQLDPAEGIATDLTVLGAGAIGTVLVLGLLGTLGRARTPQAADRLAARPLLAGLAALRPSVTPGVRLAVGGTLHQRRQFWTTVILSAGGLGLLVSGLSFVAALDRLTDEPARYGVGWDLTTRNAFGDVPPESVRALIADDPDIEGVAQGTLNSIVAGNGLDVPVMAFLPLTADLWPTVEEGRVPTSDDEALVGRDVLEALDLAVGDEVPLRSPYAPDAEPTSVTIVGAAVFPSIELAGTDPARLGQGIAITWDTYRSIIGGGADFGFEDVAPDMVFFDLAEGTDPQRVIERYPDGMPEVSGFAPTEWLSSLAPAEVIETDRASGLIWGVIALLALTVLASLAHALAGSVRQHRRDYATLKAIGFGRRQLLGLVTWQAMVPVVLALLVALPLGTALGRWWWQLLARSIGVIDTPVVPLAALLVVALATVAAAGLLAILPGLQAARSPAAAGLTDEPR